MTHSPSPWTSFEDYEERVVIVDALGREIAHIFRGPTEVDWEANAVLMNEAPAMLDAIEAALELLTNHHQIARNPDVNDACDVLAAAANAARGVAP